MIKIVIDGAVRGKQRPRLTRSGHVYTPKETRDAEAGITRLASVAMAGRDLLTGPVSLNIFMVIEPPKSTPKRRREWMIEKSLPVAKKPDLDNIAKLVGDALNGVVFEDDSQVAELWVRRVYGEVSKTVIAVSSLELCENQD